MNRVEDNQAELMAALQSKPGAAVEVLTIEMVDRMNERDFEALVGWLYGAGGDSYVLLPLTRDAGVDVIARQGMSYKLVQVKHSIRGMDVPDSAIDQVLAGANFYQQHIQGSFQMIVFSNARGCAALRDKAMRIGGVHLVLRNELNDLLMRHRPTLSDVVVAGAKRTATCKEGIRLITSLM